MTEYGQDQDNFFLNQQSAFVVKASQTRLTADQKYVLCTGCKIFVSQQHEEMESLVIACKYTFFQIQFFWYSISYKGRFIEWMVSTIK
jgi:hypothetical protein